MIQVFRLTVLLLLGYTLGALIGSGQIMLYMNPRYVPLLEFALGFILFLAALTLWNIIRMLTSARASFRVWQGLPVIVLLAALSPWVFPPQALDSSMLVQKGLLTFQKKTPAATASVTVVKNMSGSNETITLTDKNFMAMFAKIQHSPEEYVGKDLEMEGFIAHHPAIGADRYLVVRYAISCCVADATVLGFLVDGKADYPDETWVHIKGTLSLFEGRPVLQLAKAEKKATPDNPYVFTTDGIPSL